MLSHQYKAQLDILGKEKDRAIKQMTMQYEQQYTQQSLAIEQAQKQQLNQLEMARAQRDMAISQQAHQMMAQAQQYKMQIEMQQQMASAYGSAYSGMGGAKDTKPAGRKPEAKTTTPTKTKKA